MSPSPPVGPWRKLAFAALLAVYFFLVSWDTLKAGFTADEPMAIYIYWHPSPWRLLTSQFLLWRGYFRPLGGAFYIPTFLTFGLNSVPYHAFLLALLLAGAYLMYRFARALGAGELAAGMVALIACYHGGLSNLYYESVFVFDVLCGIFCLAAFTYYARIRASGSLLTRRQTLGFLGLYLCALNSKEMAVTMPVMLLAYEWLYGKPPRLAVARPARMAARPRTRAVLGGPHERGLYLGKGLRAVWADEGAGLHSPCIRGTGSSISRNATWATSSITCPDSGRSRPA